MRRLPAVAVVLLTGVCFAGEPAGTSDEEQVRFFETAVRPLLVARCQECHGPREQWAGLRLDGREALLRGGESGPAVTPGRPEESRLLRAVRRADGVEPMPPEDEGEPLTEAEIATLERWIAAGAVFPQAAPAAEKDGETHWAFRPPADVPVPEVRDSSWPRTAIDRFILARLESAKVAPALPADPRTLLRRVTFDLTGLPPTPEEVEAFVNDTSPDAYERAVDRLLASPAYGERWGRHWLDVARYADSNGLDENVAHGNAWRYRDYVIAAFNADKPFDGFLTEQLAGDLLDAAAEPDRRENLIATGFLVLGPKVLAEVDEKKMEMDIVDEQIDTVGRAFLGMTFGCARCHDHKFDPISTADYYGLAGIFKSTRTMESFTKIARWNEIVLPGDETRTLTAAYEQQKAAAKASLDTLLADADTKLAASGIVVPATPAEREALYPEGTKSALTKAREDLAKLEKSPPELPSAMGAADGTVTDVAIHLRGSHLSLGEVVPRHVPCALEGPSPPAFPAEHSGRLELARWLTDPGHPLTSRVIVNRVWRWHFGEGLVRTPDNFGLLGEEPTHAELLDWLARRFIGSGWSNKELHREIVLSSTYRQADIPRPGVAERDPENRLFGRANVRRLEAEEVRDALLAVSGRLDRRMGGSLVTVKNREFFFDHTSKDGTRYESRRRSLYLPVVRNNVYDFLRLMDFPDPAVSSGDRASTTVAPQALLMMNGDLVTDAAAALADRVAAESGSDEGARIVRLYQIAYARDPTPRELEESLSFVRETQQVLGSADPGAAWPVFCQVMLASNEFVYVR